MVLLIIFRERKQSHDFNVEKRKKLYYDIVVDVELTENSYVLLGDKNAFG